MLDNVTYIHQIPLSWYKAIDRLLHTHEGDGIVYNADAESGPTIALNTERIQAMIADTAVDKEDLVTLSTAQTITGAKVFTAHTRLNGASFTNATSQGKPYGYTHWYLDDVLVGRIITSAAAIRLRAYDGSDYSGISLDHGGTDGAKRQLLENEPSADTLSNSSSQIASRGWVNAHFLRSVDDSSYVKTSGNQEIGGTKSFMSTPYIKGSSYSYLYFSSSASPQTDRGYIVSGDGTGGGSIHVRALSSSGYTGIGIGYGQSGTYQNLQGEPTADTTSTSSAQIASRGWTNDHFFRKSSSDTGFAYNTAGTISYKAFGTSAGTVAEGNHTHSEYITQSDLSGLATTAGVAAAIQAALEDYSTTTTADGRYVTLSTAQTVSGAKNISNNLTLTHAYAFAASDSYRSILINENGGTLTSRLESFNSSSGYARFRLYATNPDSSLNASVGVVARSGSGATSEGFVWADRFVAGKNGETVDASYGYMKFDSADGILSLKPNTSDASFGGKMRFDFNSQISHSLSLAGTSMTMPSGMNYGGTYYGIDVRDSNGAPFVKVTANSYSAQEDRYSILDPQELFIRDTVGFTYPHTAKYAAGGIDLKFTNTSNNAVFGLYATPQSVTIRKALGSNTDFSLAMDANDNAQIDATNKICLSKHPAITDKSKTTSTTDAEALQIATVGYVNESGGSAENPGNYTIKATNGGEGAEAADSTAWTVGQRPSGATVDFGVEVTIQTRTYYDHLATTPVLYGYYRTLTYDKNGRLYSVSGETRYVIDTPVVG